MAIATLPIHFLPDQLQIVVGQFLFQDKLNCFLIVFSVKNQFVKGCLWRLQAQNGGLSEKKMW